MPLRNSFSRYGSVSKTFHWLTVLLILVDFLIGLVAGDLPHDTPAQIKWAFTVFSLHKTLGIVLLGLALMRILWAVIQPKPRPLHPERRYENLLAETIHWLLYLSLIIIPLSGWLEHATTTGFAPIWWPFGQSLPFIPKSETLQGIFAAWHGITTSLLEIVVFLHVAGALKHWLIDRDHTMARMLPGNPLMADLPAPDHSDRPPLRPAVLAIGIYALVLFAGSIAGLLFSEGGDIVTAQATQPQPPLPEPAATGNSAGHQWVVTDGTLELSIRQFGKEVKGNFSDWSANISFAPLPEPTGRQGHVTVDVNIRSLSLGSVTQQAMGFDFFAADTYPTARFDADIMPITDGFAAKGTLTLKGVTQPLNFPFALTITDGVAQMSGQISLNRLDYGIGANLPDESSLGFDVVVTVALTARKAAE